MGSSIAYEGDSRAMTHVSLGRQSMLMVCPDSSTAGASVFVRHPRAPGVITSESALCGGVVNVAFVSLPDCQNKNSQS